MAGRVEVSRDTSRMMIVIDRLAGDRKIEAIRSAAKTGSGSSDKTRRYDGLLGLEFCGAIGRVASITRSADGAFHA